MNELDFNGKKVLVTGGSDGIGLGIAKAFKNANAEVSITGTRSAGDYQHGFDGMTFHQLDVGDSEAVDTLIDGLDDLEGLKGELHIIFSFP